MGSRVATTPTSAGGAAEFDHIIKLLLIGDSGVGKSCLLLRFVDDKFSTSFITTIGIDFRVRTIVIDGKRVKLQVWDTAGQERFRTITQAYYRGAQGILLVYDVGNVKSFENVVQWLDTIKLHTKVDGVVYMLVGNKCDLRPTTANITPKSSTNPAGKETYVTYAEGEQFARENNLSDFIETSAKDNLNVQETFQKIASACLKIIATAEKKKNNTVDLNTSNNANGNLRSRCCSRN